MTYTASIDKDIPGFDIFVREAEGTIDFHYGRTFNKTVLRLESCGPYVATIFKDGAQFDQFPVPDHWWGSIVQYPLTAVTIRPGGDPTSLIAAGVVPPIGDTGIQSGPVIDWINRVVGPSHFEGPMGTAGMVTREYQTGGRGEIGIVHDKAAKFLLTGDATDMLELAKASASMPMWWTDEDTGKPVDMLVKPKANTYWSPAQGEPWLGPFPYTDRMPWGLDAGHMCDIAGVAALATGAPRYVRATQYRVVATLLGDNAGTAETGGFSIFPLNQVRGTAWPLRELAYCILATRLAEDAGNLPSDCLSSAQLKQVLDNHLTFYTARFMRGPEQIFRCWPDPRGAFWQCDFLSQALALLADNFPEWRPLYIWSLGQQMARTNGREWPPADPCVYYIALFKDSTPTSNYGTVYYDSWALCRAAYEDGQRNGTDQLGLNGSLSGAQIDALHRDPFNGGHYLQPSEYNSHLFGALAYAVHLDRKWGGLISQTYPELERVYAEQYVLTKDWGNISPQNSIAVDPKPVTLPPPGLPITVHGLLLRAQKILALIK